ncbi:hypothetical protein RND71_007790 [Anisodus tanguticus]|uniref:Uncharacterized protein n=1 Tax=Anisodus tanguticus TaxID=243964 RepID=A0AAE1SMJ5_9SOLA|nr:hypothetical protein RND71_007790 [Anisodus tanguticus]
MVLEISLIDLQKEEKDEEYNDPQWIYDAYNVYVGDHRILTIVTDSYKTTTKWFNELLHKATPNNKHGCILVSVFADRDPDRYHYNWDKKKGDDEKPYHLLQVSTGSQCLLYRLPSPNDDRIPKAMKAFFADPRVMAVGVKMRGVINRLKIDHGITFANPVDLNKLAVKGLNRDDLDLGRYDLDRLAKTVLGKHWDVMRPVRRLLWFLPWGRWWRDELNPEKVEYATVDPYLCFMISLRILEGMDDKWYPKPLEEFLVKNKKKKNKSKKKF